MVLCTITFYFLNRNRFRIRFTEQKFTLFQICVYIVGEMQDVPPVVASEEEEKSFKREHPVYANFHKLTRPNRKFLHPLTLRFKISIFEKPPPPHLPIISHKFLGISIIDSRNTRRGYARYHKFMRLTPRDWIFAEFLVGNLTD